MFSCCCFCKYLIIIKSNIQKILENIKSVTAISYTLLYTSKKELKTLWFFAKNTHKRRIHFLGTNCQNHIPSRICISIY